MDYFADLAENVRLAMAEDLGGGDLTAALIPAGRRARARVIVREAAVVCGTRWFDAVYAAVDPSVQVQWQVEDGAKVEADTVLCEITGSARALVSGERPALNFLQSLSGTATVTARYVAQLAGTTTRLLDTRKTIPGLRRAQKYAVKCGGGYNHRAGLYDGILIKENHISAAGGVMAAIQALRATDTPVPIEVEVETLAQIEEAIAAGADMLLLDNFALTDMREAVALAAGRVPLEASGGFDFDDLPAVAATGVDYVSVGALTKHLRAVDLSMRISDLS
ncbi:MAG: carboxylating nicotinate-nucleotide diphosphorylase [Gammaproteobacteria bacterium]|nr:carboxylating nicotinate-nucleotide diphosphorylase [Gammaproteobacteria bacterium]